MRKEYHYLIAGLPDVFFDDNKQVLSLSDYQSLLEESLTDEDFHLVTSIFLKDYNKIVIARLESNDEEPGQDEKLLQGNVDELFQAIKEGDTEDSSAHIPLYLSRFIDAFHNSQPIIDNKSWENQLTSLYYDYLLELDNQFIQKWYQFELRLQNIQAAHQCRKHELDISAQLIGNDETNHKLERSSARDFGLVDEVPFLEDILKALEENDLFEREKRIDRIRWNYLDEEVFFHYFTIEHIFAYTVKLTIIDRWMNLDGETGQKLFNEFISSLKNSYQLPREFSLN